MIGDNVGKHAWLMENVFFLGDNEDSVLSISRADTREGKPTECKLVFNRKDVAAEHFNLLRASPMLYQQLTYQYEVLQAVIDNLYGNPLAEKLATNLIDAQNSIMLTQRAAIEGIEKVADELDRKEPT